MATIKIDYKKLSTKLDEILAKLQSDDLDVDKALEDYEEGIKIIKQLEKYLKEAENKIKKTKL